MKRSADKLIIIGAGSFSIQVIQYIKESRGADVLGRIAGFLDDDPQKRQQQSPYGKVIGTVAEHRVDSSHEYVLAIGDPLARKRIAELLSNRGARFATLTHPLASIERSATIGIGCIVAQFVTIGAFAKIGAHTILTEYTLVAHHSKVGPYCVLSPFSGVTGGAELREGVFLGVHSAITPGKKVGRFSKVAAGSIVYREIPAYALAKGNPAIVRSFPRWVRSRMQRD